MEILFSKVVDKMEVRVTVKRRYSVIGAYEVGMVAVWVRPHYVLLNAIKHLFFFLSRPQVMPEERDAEPNGVDSVGAVEGC